MMNSPQTKKETIIIAGYYGFGNFGDELILRALIQQLRDKNPECQITVFSHRPQQTADHFQVQAINRWRPWAWLRPLARADRFILGGGGLLQESTGPLNYFYYLSLLLLAKCFRCRTEVHAIGVDPIDQLFNRLWTRFVFDSWVDYISVRDADSQRALESVGVLTRIWRVPDLVFRLEMPAKKPIVESSAVALAVTEWPQRPGWEHDLAFLLERVQTQLQVPLELLVFYPAEDAALAQRVADLTGHKVTVRICEHAEDLLTAVSDYGLIVGMRYHALALAALAGRAFIGWGVQRKVRALCREFNQPMWTFERGWDADAVYRQICDAWKQRQSLSERYQAHLAQWVHAAPVASESARIFVAQV
jgi:polysaccharide pyruvyl transferase CsaB